MSLAKHWGYSKDLVLESLKGLTAANPKISLIPAEKTVVYNDSLQSKGNKNSNHIMVISGGGAGHEPLHAGFVGVNALDAAVSGSIFASPSAKQIFAAIKSISSKENNSKGTLVIVKNYTGDVLHFGLAVERAKAHGYKTDMIIVGDDAAVGRSKGGMVGRRALAATALVHKIVGSAASEIEDLCKLKILGDSVANNVVTIGATLDHCSVPGRDIAKFEPIGYNDAEIGLGIHNETSVKKVKPVPMIDSLVKDLLEFLLNENDKDRYFVPFDLSNDETVLLINNLGGTSSLEMFAITNCIIETLSQQYSLRPKKVIVGEFVTSLNVPGFSITLLNISCASKQSQISISKIMSYLNLPTDAPGWKAHPWEFGLERNINIESTINGTDSFVKSHLKLSKEQQMDFISSLVNGLEKLLDKEPCITLYDTVAGDGDCGETLASGANGILESIRNNEICFEDPVYSISQIANIVEDKMGGTSGGLYSIFLTSLIKSLQDCTTLNLCEMFAGSLHNALYQGLYKYTRARVGGRTLIDALEPFVNTLNDTLNFPKAAQAAIDGSESTRKLAAKFGRASYVNEQEFKQFDEEGGLPDPGAIGLATLIAGFAGVDYN